MSEVQLGKTTGSLVNALYALESVQVPAIGDGATLLFWSDRKPATVVDVEEQGKAIIVTIQEDKAHRVDKNGFSERQTYLYTPNPNAPKQYFRITATGNIESIYKNEETGRWNKSRDGGIYFGRREKFHDFSF